MQRRFSYKINIPLALMLEILLDLFFPQFYSLEP